MTTHSLSSSGSSSDSTVLILNDLDQVIFSASDLSSGGGADTGRVQWEVWDSHWSPRLFRVASTAVWAVPPYADRPDLLNAGELAGRIAVVMRGEVPVSAKALAVQRAGN